MKIRLLILSLLIAETVICQQNKNVNTLLWRISGKGLAKNSYLFGTMHLTDKRIFQLTDSLYNALERSEGFAAELDMNQMGNQSINNFFIEEDEKRSKEAVKVKDAVSPEIWRLYQARLSEKLYKSPDKITVDDLDNIDTRLKSELIQKGEMNTFLDAYLFDLARKQGKWVGGLEEFEDQEEHLQSESVEEKIQTALFDDTYYRSGIEWMIKTYINQQLDSIDVMTYRENGRKDLIMIKRNLKMARGIDSLSAVRSTLFAVGAAHLPGDSGLIALLQSKGFTVTPVLSQKKINPDKYTYRTIPALWEKLIIEDSMYTLEMPGKSNPFRKLEEFGIPALFFFDIALMKMYMTMHIGIPEERRKLGPDSLYKGIKDRFQKQGKLNGEKKIMINSTEGHEYRFSSKDGEFLVQVFMPDGKRAIMNMVFASKKSSLAEPDTRRFFQSFVNNANYREPAKSAIVWTDKTFTPYSFSVSLPLNPVEKKDVNSEEGKIIHTYQAFQVGYPNFFGIVVSSTKEGVFFSMADSAYFLTIKENIKWNFKDAVILDSAFSTVSGLPAFRLRMHGKSDNENLELNILAVIRGNRSYYLYSLYEPGDEGKTNADRFIRSFKLNPYEHTGWQKRESPDASFFTTSPLPFREKPLEEDDIHPGAQRWTVYDSLAAITLFADKIQVPDWFWYESDTAFLRQRAAKYHTASDSVSGYTIHDTGPLKSVEFKVNNRGSQMVKKVKILLNGSELYEIFANMSQQDLTTVYARFYDDFTITGIAPATGNKGTSNRLFSDILPKNDSALNEQIKIWWDDLHFTVTDIPALQQAMLKTYPDFDSNYSSDNLNGKIFDALEKLDSTQTTLGVIRNNYASILPKDELLKPFIISYLSRIHTAESYNLIKSCLQQFSFPDHPGMYFFHSLDDSLALTARLFPELMKKTANEGLWEIVCSSTVSLYDSSLLSNSAIKQYAPGFIALAKKILKKDTEEIEENAYLYHDLIKILGIIGLPETNNLLNQFSKYSDRRLRFHTLLAKLTANMPVDSKTIYTLASADEFRHDLFDAFSKMNKLSLFPRDFLSQKDLAKSKIYMYAWDEDPPEMVTPVGEKMVLYKGKPSKFFLYKVKLNGSDSYLGIGGPYSLKAGVYQSTHDATGIYWEKTFDAKKVDSLFNEYLESIAENEE